MEPLFIHDGLTLPPHELSFHAVRAGGPGGQHVNKVSSKVELSFHLDRCEGLADDVKQRLRSLARGRLTSDGRLVIASQQSREQHRNLEHARQRLRALILEALTPPAPRKPTKTPRWVGRARVADKRRRAAQRAVRRVGSEE